jgi:hypothetical protein
MCSAAVVVVVVVVVVVAAAAAAAVVVVVVVVVVVCYRYRFVTICPALTETHPASYPVGIGGGGASRQGREVDHSPPYIVSRLRTRGVNLHSPNTSSRCGA